MLSLPPFLLLLPLLRRPPPHQQEHNSSLGNVLLTEIARPAAAGPRLVSATRALSLRVLVVEDAVALLPLQRKP